MGFLIKAKCAETILKYIKLFIQINKKPKILECDNGTEFANHLISNFMESKNIKLIHSRSHHPQSNGCLEHYFYEVQKYMYIYLKDIETINDDKIYEALTNYIEYNNNTMKSSTKFISNDIRIWKFLI